MRDEPRELVDNAARKAPGAPRGRLTAASAVLADLTKAGKLNIAAGIYDLKMGASSPT